ncbi:hypothetical protein [Arenimonas fontis]|uniref:Lipocalin-like domain-containing protein n=1 Tax=Arenimonas fontis TaxID=2608255 RepID=A0A5B2ZF57_9GAMM|nr:hypothetical protein [Arenimonas fontis]KAA2285711.1 hypothetical protein F0415_03545 [Arenimonas fontis]
MRAAMLRGVWLLALASLLAGCERPVPQDFRDYVGHWRGEGMLVVISASGHGHYERVRGRQRTSIEGPVHSFSRSGFRIGIGALSARFEVNEPPHRDEDGRWRMTVDGVELTRLEIAPADAEGGEGLRI